MWSQPRNGKASFTAVDQKACPKNMSLRSGEASFTATYQKVWALCFCPPPLRFIALLKIIKVRMPKNKFFFCKTVKRNGSNTSLGQKKISQCLGCLPRSVMFNVVSSTFLQYREPRPETTTKFFRDLIVLLLSSLNCA